jgi:hypothetical protein
MNAPLDQLHEDCLREREWIRQRIALLRHHVSVWRPRPMPDNWTPHEERRKR